MFAYKNNFNISQIEECFTTIFDKDKNDENNKKKYIKPNNNNVDNLVEKSNFNLLVHDENENIYNNDRLLKELDKLIIKPKVDNSNNAPRI